MIFLPLFLLLLPSIVDGIRPFGKCHNDACLQYTIRCDEGRGVWTAKTKNEKMDDSRCTLKDDDIKYEMPHIYSEDYFHLGIEIVSPTQWTLSIFGSSSIWRSVTIKSSRIYLRKNDTGAGWALTVDEIESETKYAWLEDKSNKIYKILMVELNETTPLLDLFSGARIGLTMNNTNVTYEDPQIWTFVAERGPIQCSRRDTKPAFLVILIAYAVFATIVAILIFIMIHCIAREAKYKQVPTKSDSIPSKRKKSKKETKKESKKETTKESKIPDFDPTTQGTKEVADNETKEPTATDISRLQTESKLSKKTRE